VIEIDGSELPEHVSYSAMTTWLSCGWKYYLKYAKKMAEQPAWWFYGGSAVHQATENYDQLNP